MKAYKQFHYGNSYDCYTFLGSHIISDDESEKTVFRVWAPNARAVHLVGDFNHWNRENHPLSWIEGTMGLWEIIINNNLELSLYKYCITRKNGSQVLKADPYARYSELKPNTASRVYRSEYSWKDEKWQKKLSNVDILKSPVNIYEVHAGSWQRDEDGKYLSYRELAEQLIPYVKKLKYTHIELMPLTEYPFDGSWGYQATGYFCPTSRYGTPDDLRYFVDQCHQANIGIVLDWVPGHFCKDEHGLFHFDGTMLYGREEHAHWGTMNFDFGCPEVRSFLTSSAYYWFREFHIDGIRVDGVASMIYLNYGYDTEERKNQYGGTDNIDAIEFIKHLNGTLFAHFPYAIMSAEDSTAYPNITKPTYDGGLGFNFKWNLGWMHDTLKFLSYDPFYRGQIHYEITFSMAYHYSENFILPLSHDEVVHGKKSLLEKMHGDYDEKFSNFKLLFAYMILHPGKKLSFMGNEYAPFLEWRYYEPLEWFMMKYPRHKSIYNFMSKLNNFYLRQPALWELDYDYTGFKWIDADNINQSVLIFMRQGESNNEKLIIVINFSKCYYENFNIGVPAFEKYRCVFNTDLDEFGGGNHKTKKQVKVKLLETDNIWHGYKQYIDVHIPPLSVIVYKPVNRKKGK